MAIRLTNKKVAAKSQGQEITASMQWSPQFKQQLDGYFGKGGRLQILVDSLILESIEPYVPRDSGMLMASSKLYSQIGQGKLIWRTPYALYHYHGKLMVDPDYQIGAFHDPQSGRFWSRRGVRKILTDKDLRYQGAKRGPNWPDAWKKDNLQEFESKIQNKAGVLWRGMRKGV